MDFQAIKRVLGINFAMDSEKDETGWLILHSCKYMKLHKSPDPLPGKKSGHFYNTLKESS